MASTIQIRVDDEKIKSIFLSLLKNIKKEYTAPPDNIFTINIAYAATKR